MPERGWRFCGEPQQHFQAYPATLYGVLNLEDGTYVEVQEPLQGLDLSGEPVTYKVRVKLTRDLDAAKEALRAAVLPWRGQYVHKFALVEIPATVVAMLDDGTGPRQGTGDK
jgi:hypothetical protein